MYLSHNPASTSSLQVPHPHYVQPFDPRNSSSQSLAPSRIENDHIDQRRRLLVIYIHGFIGNDDSFHSFPYHVHVALKEKVAATHAVHSKIYPRYKTYKAFHLARDNFSDWLSAHESPNTDVILVGHSMGGLLAAEVVLMPDTTNPTRKKHRILGTVNMDVPFLGAQNRVYLAGILSPFRSKKSDPFRASHDNVSPRDTSNLTAESETSSLQPSRSIASTKSPTTSSNASFVHAKDTSDPTFNPPFSNDIRITNRDWWENVRHFRKKHKDDGGLLLASLRHWKEHFEFGSCLLDSRRLKIRYNALRKLDTATSSDTAPKSTGNASPQVRFAQFYTACRKGRAGKHEVRQAETNEVSPEPSYYATSQPAINENEQIPSRNDEDPERTEEEEDLLYFVRLARQRDGEVDPSWHQVMIATNDEIHAHTSLFIPGSHYDNMIEKVSAEIAQWVLDSTRLS